MSIISFAGQKSRTQAAVVRQPAFLLSSQKEVEWWAEGGLVYCFNPNKPEKGRTFLQPLEALQRVAHIIKLFVADCREKPEDYAVTLSVMASFFNEFKTKVFDVALAQDEAAGNVIKQTNEEFVRQRRTAHEEQAIARAKAAEGRPKIYLPRKKADEE